MSAKSVIAPHSPSSVRVINWLLAAIGITQYSRDRWLSAGSILRAVPEQEVDTDFVSLLEVYLNSLDEQSISFTGAFALRELLRSAASNYHRLTAAQQSPSTLSTTPTPRPIFIVGFPRTGTSLLHSLLALDPDRQAPKMWELHEPALSSSAADQANMRKDVARFVDANNFLAPRLKDVHPMAVDGNEECLKLLENTLISPSFLLYNSAPGYEDWLLSHLHGSEVRSAYQLHRFQLQLLQHYHGRSANWVLKSPAHALLIRGLSEVYPDSILINTHRSPTKSIPSFCSLVEVVRSAFCSQLNLSDIGQLGLRFFEHCEIEYRGVKSRSDNPIIDISFDKLVKNPVACIETMYAHLGLSFSTEFQDNIHRWMQQDSEGLKSKHDYSAQRFELQDSKIEAQFQSYSEFLTELDLNDGVQLYRRPAANGTD